MLKYFLVAPFVLMAILAGGCAQKITIKSLEPAEVDKAADTKVIAVLPFRYDNIGLSDKIEARFATYKIGNEPYFTVVNRTDIDDVIMEQDFQNSEYADIENIVEPGAVIGAEAIVSGSFGGITANTTYFYKKKSRYIKIRCHNEKNKDDSRKNKKKCKKRIYYKVECKRREVGISADIRLIDVRTSKIIHADNFFETTSYSSCRDEYTAIPSDITIAQNLAQYIADSFVYKLTPHYRYRSVELLENEDIDYDSIQKRLLKSSLEYIEYGNYYKAEKLLQRLAESTGYKSYVPLYNLGVIYEAKGDYNQAREYYIMADDLVIEPVEQVTQANMRINSVIYNYNKTQEQIQR